MKATINKLLALLEAEGIQVTNPRSGIRWYSITDRWQVTIKHEGKTKHIGYFQSLYSAVIAREQAELQFYPNGRPPKKDRKSKPEVQPEDDARDESEFFD